MQPFLEIKERPVHVTARVQMWEGFPEHLHSHAELFYVAEGNRQISIESKIYTLRAGDIALIFPNVIHGYLPAEPNSAAAVLLIFSPEISADYGNLLRTRLPQSPVVRASGLHADVARAIRAICEESRGAGAGPVVKAYVQVALARLLPAMALLDNSAGRERDGTLQRLLRYMAEHYQEHITLESASEDLGVSRSYLSHIFSDRLKVNFRAYINVLRINRAQQLLLTTSMSITQISLICGYENQRTFNRAFMLASGVTPSQYREGKTTK